MYHFLFPGAPFDDRKIDSTFLDQALALREAGFETSVHTDRNRLIPPISGDSTVVYRGWMFSGERYDFYLEQIKGHNLTPLTTLEQYLSAHWLPNWYPMVDGVTPETLVFPKGVTASVPEGWTKYQVKDYVKSLKTAGGSTSTDPKELLHILDMMNHYRGDIEGGVCIRRFEEFIPGSEIRHFCINGKVFGPLVESSAEIAFAQSIARYINSPFFSVDVATNTDGNLRLVEIGDGQVSDLVGDWTPQRFAEIWKQSV